jgi:hypothetical protein
VAVPFVLSLLSISCGSQTPTGDLEPPAPVTVAGTATPAPTATPRPSTGDCPNGQTAVTTLEIKVFSVQTKQGELRPYEVGGPIYVDEVVRFDSQGKDRFRARTNGCDPKGTRWDWGPDAVMMLQADSGWNPRAIALSAGEFTVQGNLDHIHSEPLHLTVVDGTPPKPVSE